MGGTLESATPRADRLGAGAANARSALCAGVGPRPRATVGQALHIA